MIRYYSIPGLHGTDQAKKIKEALEGKTYMDFHVEYGGVAHNNTIIVSTNCNTDQKEFEEFVIFFLASSIK